MTDPIDITTRIRDLRALLARGGHEEIADVASRLAKLSETEAQLAFWQTEAERLVAIGDGLRAELAAMDALRVDAVVRMQTMRDAMSDACREANAAAESYLRDHGKSDVPDYADGLRTAVRMMRKGVPSVASAIDLDDEAYDPPLDASATTDEAAPERMVGTERVVMERERPIVVGSVWASRGGTYTAQVERISSGRVTVAIGKHRSSAWYSHADLRAFYAWVSDPAPATPPRTLEQRVEALERAVFGDGR